MRNALTTQLGFVCLTLLSILSLGLNQLPEMQEPEEPVIHITQVDSSEFPRLTVYVSVTDSAGEPVGIDPSQLVFYEDGVELDPNVIQSSGPVDSLMTLLVFDVSGSMNEAGKLESAKQAAAAFVDMAQSGDVIGILSFDTEIQLVQPFTSDQSALYASIDKLYGVRDTAMYDALMAGAAELQNGSGRKSLIVLTDGMDNRSTSGLDDVIAQIGPAGLTISTVGLGDPQKVGSSFEGLDLLALQTLADRAGGQYADATSTSDLVGLYQRYSRVLQSEYAISYISPGELRDGINRNISVEFRQGAALPSTSTYNPGGVVPETINDSGWIQFVGLGLILVGLILLPGLVRSLIGQRQRLQPADSAARSSGSSRIRFTDKGPPKKQV